MTEDINDFTNIVEIDIILCMENPQFYIDSFVTNVHQLFKDAINGTLPIQVAERMEKVNAVWCENYIETLTSFIENLTPRFISDLSWNNIFECDNQFLQSLYYRTFIIKKAIISSDEYIAEMLETGLKNSLKRCIALFGNKFQNRFNQE